MGGSSFVAFTTLIAAIGLHTSACAADLFKCTDAASKVTYQAERCPASSAVAKIEVAPSSPREKILRTPESLARRCLALFEGQARDPANVRFDGHTTDYDRNGVPVLTVHAITQNKFGGPQQTRLKCDLTPDLKDINVSDATALSILEFSREQRRN